TVAGNQEREVEATLRGGLGTGYHADNILDHPLDQADVVSFRHDTDQRLGAGRTDDQPALLAQSRAGIRDDGLDRLAFERLAARELDVLEDLRHRLEPAADLTGRTVHALDRSKDLQGADKAIAGRREIRQHDMARLLAADIEA